ncbi:MAG: SUMF1/EgtB/PvdO family nonheme iron enzyme [Saprospiraceae bacterium]|nr:SUMF1/EgtB/PvdO family nonheme iron enzyme [Saprospiraceae bacterium]
MRPLKTFIIYARKDESFKNDLLLHLRSALIPSHLEVWQDGEILPGEDWAEKIGQQLAAADLFLVLLSVHSLTSEFIQNVELKKALDKKSHIVPILVRNCFWQNHSVFAGLQGLPRNMKPVSAFSDHDDAWTEVMSHLHELVEATWKAKAQAAKAAAPTASAPKTATLKAAPPPEPIPPLPGLPDMVLVKGGTFTMGSPKTEADRSDDETQHPVTLSDFEIGKYPVTQQLWQDIMGNNPSGFKGDDLPVEKVSWDDVQDFLQKLNARYPGQRYRLPTEAEWEYAARGGNQSKGFIYAGGNNLDEVGWYAGNSELKTHPVGQKKANELGLYDMSGNVWEWCADWYGAYPSGPQTNPPGPEPGSSRVIRGGSWYYNPQDCRVAYRHHWRPGGRGSNVGFRLASSPQ